MADLSVCVRRRCLRSGERVSRKWWALNEPVRVFRYGVSLWVPMREVRVGDLVKKDADEEEVQELLRVTGWDHA